MNFRRELEFTTAINTLSNFVASQFKNANELSTVASVFSQMGDTLETIVSMREQQNSSD